MSTTTTTTATIPPPAEPGTGANKANAENNLKVPWPESKEAQPQRQLEQMAGAFRIFAKFGYAYVGSGHISLRAEPYAVHFGLLRVSNKLQVDEEGKRISGAGLPLNTAGFIIHAANHRARPDINAACHVHSPYGRAWRNFGRGIDMLNEDSCMFHDDLAIYNNFGGVVFAAEEGGRVAAADGSSRKSMIMQNHGLLTCGGTVAEAAAFFVALERVCHTQLLTEAAVAPSTASAASKLSKTFVGEEAAYTKKGTGSPEVMYKQFLPEYQTVLKETGGDFLG